MTDEEIKFLLSEDNNEVIQAHKEIVSLQKDKSSLLVFGKPWLDDNIVAGINNKILFFGSRPGGGKTYHCSETINALLDRELNPTPVKVCRFNLEMPTQTLLLQQISRTLKKTPKEILEKPYSEEEKPVIKKIVGAFKDSRIKNISRVLVGEDFKKFVLAFIKEIDEADAEINIPALESILEGITDEKKIVEIKENFTPIKTKKVCLIDHLHIYRSKEEIDTLLLICNALKMQDKNLSFIIYFQLRRDVEDLWRGSKDTKVNPRNILPNSTFIYQTDVLQQVADIVVGMVIPQVYDLDEFAAVHKERNQHLKLHFSNDTTDGNYTRTKGRNRIYYNYMKIRLINSFDDPRLFCDILNPAYEETSNRIYEENKRPSLPPISFDTPTFDSTVPLPEIDFNQIGSIF
jgi:hypothetical protein